LLLFISSSNFIQAWITIELNLLFFVFFIKNAFMNNIENIFKYFIVQSLRSLLILFLILFNFNTSIILMLCIFKLGIFPLHYWAISLIKKLRNYLFFIFLRIQKFQIIIFIVIFIKNAIYSLIFIILITFIYILILKEVSFKIFIFYSSINFTFLFFINFLLFKIWNILFLIFIFCYFIFFNTKWIYFFYKFL